MTRAAVILVAVVVVAALTAPPALAHKLKVFAAAEGDAIVGTAYFAGGGAVIATEGTVATNDGTVIARFRTDAEGNFRVAAPAGRDVRVRIDSGDGHLAEALVSADERPATPSSPTAAAPAPSAAAELEAAVARQVIPLRRQIDALEDRTRFSDIMGGVGTIFGVFGIAAWVAARRDKRP